MPCVRATWLLHLNQPKSLIIWKGTKKSVHITSFQESFLMHTLSKILNQHALEVGGIYNLSFQIEW